jgi:hypothetical protein
MIMARFAFILMVSMFICLDVSTDQVVTGLFDGIMI